MAACQKVSDSQFYFRVICKITLDACNQTILQIPSHPKSESLLSETNAGENVEEIANGNVY